MLIIPVLLNIILLLSLATVVPAHHGHRHKHKSISRIHVTETRTITIFPAASIISTISAAPPLVIIRPTKTQESEVTLPEEDIHTLYTDSRQPSAWSARPTRIHGHHDRKNQGLPTSPVHTTATTASISTNSEAHSLTIVLPVLKIYTAIPRQVAEEMDGLGINNAEHNESEHDVEQEVGTNWIDDDSGVGDGAHFLGWTALGAVIGILIVG